jgi:hypothetical protein
VGVSLFDTVGFEEESIVGLGVGESVAVGSVGLSVIGRNVGRNVGEATGRDVGNRIGAVVVGDETGVGVTISVVCGDDGE